MYVVLLETRDSYCTRRESEIGCIRGESGKNRSFCVVCVDKSRDYCTSGAGRLPAQAHALRARAHALR